MALLQVEYGTFTRGVGYQPPTCGSNGFRTFAAAVIEEKNFPKAAIAARQLVENEGSIARLHEHAFLGEVEHLDMGRGEQEGSVSVARMGLEPAEYGQRQAGEDHR